MDEQRSLKTYVAEEVRAQLARRKLSASRAAKAIGWSQPYISRRLTGETAFDLDDLEALAGLLEIPVGSLFGLQADPPRVLTMVPARSSVGGRTTASYSTPQSNKITESCREVTKMSSSRTSGPLHIAAA
jgi:transcriptional regulator with XRE-family HTH domain